MLQLLGVNKWLAYAGAALLVLCTVSIACLRIFAAGKNAESLKSAEGKLRQLGKEQSANAKAHSLDAATARRQLRERWSKR